MSLLDADLTEKIDIPMIFDAIDKLRKVMDDNLEKIAMHEKEISALYKNISSAKSELINVSALLEQITNPQPKYVYSGLRNNDLINRYDGTHSALQGCESVDMTWWLGDRIYNQTPCIKAGSWSISNPNYISANELGDICTTTCDAYDDTKTITGI